MSIPKKLLDIFPRQHSEFLKTFFACCPSEIYNCISVRQFPAHYHLIDTNDDVRYVYFLLEGKLQGIEDRIVHMPYHFLEVEPFDIVGDYEVFSNTQGHYVTLKTLQASSCLQMRANDYERWMKQDANALFLRTQMILQVLSVQTQQQRQFLFMDTNQRFANYLLDKLGDPPLFPHHLSATREQIASHIGCSVRQLNRIIKQYCDHHCLSTQHGKLWIQKEHYHTLKEKAEQEI